MYLFDVVICTCGNAGRGFEDCTSVSHSVRTGLRFVAVWNAGSVINMMLRTMMVFVCLFAVVVLESVACR